MADTIILIPKTNPLKFHEHEPHLNARYHSMQMGKDAYYLQIPEHLAKKPYAQKWQFNNRLQFQFHISRDYGSKIELVDAYGTTLHTWTSALYSAQFTVSGFNFTTPSGTVTGLKTVHYRFSYNDVPNLEPGIYWLRLTIDIDDDNDGVVDGTKVYYSEPQHIATSHKNTVTLRVRHKSNKYDTIFIQTNARFESRIEGRIADYEPLSSDTQFEDQVMRVRLLSANPAEGYGLFLGYRNGIPDYQLDIVNRMLDCSEVYAEGYEIVKEKGAQWDLVKSNRLPLCWASIRIRYSRPHNSNVTIHKPPFILWTSPGTYPYFVHSAVQYATSGSLITPVNAVEFTSAQEETAYVNYLNSTYANLFNLSGEYYQDGLNIYYRPGEDENYVAATSIVLPYHFQLTRLGLGGYTPAVSMSFLASYVGISWGGSLGTSKYGQSPANTVFTATKSGYVNAFGQHYTIRVYHSNTIKSFQCAHNGMLDISGTLPVQMISFSMTGSQMPTFDFSLLAASAATIGTINVSNNKLTAITNFNQAWGVLTSIGLDRNLLSVSQVDGAFNTFYASATSYSTLPGFFFIQQQTPAAAPTLVSASSRSDLTTLWGWALNHD